jgi:hypothetical protein
MGSHLSLEAWLWQDLWQTVLDAPRIVIACHDIWRTLCNNHRFFAELHSVSVIQPHIDLKGTEAPFVLR